VWERVWRAALAALDQQGQLDWSMAFLDGSFAPAKKGGDEVGLTKKGKGTKWMLVVEGNRLPLRFHLASARTAEVQLAEQTLDTIAGSACADAPSNDLRGWWRIADMLVARSALPCGAVVSACASRACAVAVLPAS
jgi:hypothetical protein